MSSNIDSSSNNNNSTTTTTTALVSVVDAAVVVVPEPNNNNRNNNNNNTNTSNILLDSLPYIDTIQEEYEQYAISFIEQEMKQSQQQQQPSLLHPKVTSLPKQTVYFHSTTEYEDFQEQVTMKRQRIIEEHDNEFPSIIPTDNDDTTISSWKEIIKKARMTYEKERIRSIQLHVDQDDDNNILNTNNNNTTTTENLDTPTTTNNTTSSTTSATALWKYYTTNIVQVQYDHMQQLQVQQQILIDEINYHRQQVQVQDDLPKLQVLQHQYDTLLHKLYTIQYTIQLQLQQSKELNNDIHDSSVVV